MGLKQKRGTIVLEALEIKYIRYIWLPLPTHKPKQSHPLLKYFRKEPAQQPEMPRDIKNIQIMANKKGNGPNTRFKDVRMREDSKIELCLVSAKTAEILLEGGEPESCEKQIVVLSDGTTYSCVTKFEGRWCEKANPQTDEITLYIVPEISDPAIFPKNRKLSNSGSTIAPIEERPKTAAEKKRDAEREKAAQAAKAAKIKTNQDQKKAAFTNATKKP